MNHLCWNAHSWTTFFSSCRKIVCIELRILKTPFNVNVTSSVHKIKSKKIYILPTLHEKVWAYFTGYLLYAKRLIANIKILWWQSSQKLMNFCSSPDNCCCTDVIHSLMKCSARRVHHAQIEYQTIHTDFIMFENRTEKMIC